MPPLGRPRASQGLGVSEHLRLTRGRADGSLDLWAADGGLRAWSAFKDVFTGPHVHPPPARTSLGMWDRSHHLATLTPSVHGDGRRSQHVRPYGWEALGAACDTDWSWEQHFLPATKIPERVADRWTVA